MGTITSYVPYDYRRACDLCGNLWNISKMRRQDQYTYCPDHDGERTSEALDRANAAQRPFRILPVPNAKPVDQGAPEVFENEESDVFDLVGIARAGGARYAQVEAGMLTALPNGADAVTTNAWACWYYYALATLSYTPGHQDVWTAQAVAQLRVAADALLARQTLTGTRATNSFYGGLLGSGSTTYFCEDAAVGGLAFLYAFRLLGDIKYMAAARACANFLRNLQAIGSDGEHFTSSDIFGTARLYTGAITNAVSSVAGFYSDHRFYASSLLALQFWNELRVADGDQSIGATAAISGEFTTAPSKLMSTCMSDLRTFWQTGTYDVANLDVRTGLSATTPAECFNAYPAVKPNTSVLGSGSWEYQDGPSTTGTLITGLSLAKGLSALYAVDGLTAQVTAVDAWLQTFTSNADYETPTSTSASTLARSTTGVYDATQGIAKYLLVRDPDNAYAYTAKNGSGLYDWGAFGLLAPIWATRHSYGFKLGRLASTQLRRRLSDGLPSDDFWADSGLLRGRQGLSYQTAFREVLDHGGGPAL